MESPEIRAQIITACRRLVELGCLVGTYGNISARIEGGLIITPSRVAYPDLTPEDLVSVSDAGDLIGGTRLPSSELEVHRQIYLHRPDLNAVVHTHSLYATALSCMGVTVPVIVEEQSQVIGGEISCTSYVPAGQHRQLGAEVARALGASDAVLLANHGPVSCGRSLEEALFASVVTERIAQIYLLTRAAGGAVNIPSEFVAGERDRYLNRYGTADDRVAKEYEHA